MSKRNIQKPEVITGEQFRRIYKPLRNPRRPQQCVFEEIAADAGAVFSAWAENWLTVWTILETDGNIVTKPGHRFNNNRIGFYITEVPAPHTLIEVHVDE